MYSSASEALHRIGDIRRQRIVDRDSDLVRFIDERRPSMRQNNLRPRVEGLDAPPQQVRGVEVVVGDPLEELAAGLLDHEVVIERRTAVLPVMDVPHAGINRRIMPGDLTRAIGGAVIGDDQLEVGEGLRQEGVQGCREDSARRCKQAGQA